MEDINYQPMRKTISTNLQKESASKYDVEGIYESKDLTFEKVQQKPILKPISDINNTFINLELLINKALYDYKDDKEQIDKMIEMNPTYSETMILTKFQSLLTTIKQIIHAQNLQKENLVSAIKELIRINNKEYAPLNSEDNFQKQTPATPPQEKQEIHEEFKKTTDEKKGGFFSDLLEKEVPIPQKKEVPTNSNKDPNSSNKYNKPKEQE